MRITEENPHPPLSKGKTIAHHDLTSHRAGSVSLEIETGHKSVALSHYLVYACSNSNWRIKMAIYGLIVPIDKVSWKVKIWIFLSIRYQMQQSK